MSFYFGKKEATMEKTYHSHFLGTTTTTNNVMLIMNSFLCLALSTPRFISLHSSSRCGIIAGHHKFKRVIQTNYIRSVSTTSLLPAMSNDENTNKHNDNLSLPWVQSLATTQLPKSDNVIRKQTSIFSWNILAQHLFDSTPRWYTHVSPNDPVHIWQDRWQAIKNEIKSSNGDIICLQEVEPSSFEADILPFMKEIGYDGIMQKSGRSCRYGVATFWNQQRFHEQNVSHHSRTLLVTLEDDFGFDQDEETKKEVIAIVNCHLEGNPHKSVTRVRQLQSSLKELKNKYTHHHLIICGDFNCQLGQSACSTYLHFGSCPSHIPILEFGRMLDKHQIDELDRNIDHHDYNFCSAYPMEMVTNDPLDYITFASAPGQFTVGLDQIWYHSIVGSSNNDDHAVVGLKNPFHSTMHRNQVLQFGLPSRYNPSDHMPIGCILEWQVVDDKPIRDLYQSNQLFSNDGKDRNRTEEDIFKEITEMFDNCMFDSKQQYSDFEFIISPVEGIEYGQRPTQAQISQIQQRRALKRELWNDISEDTKTILERIIVLTKDLEDIRKKAQRK